MSGFIKRNAAGVELGPHGYVLCTTCRKEVSDVSREVSPEYAKCEYHRRNDALVRSGKKIPQQHHEGDGTMSKKNYRDPAAKAKSVLTDKAHPREVIMGKLKDQGYSDATVQAQLYNLRHWKGCVVTDDGYAKNPDFVEEEKPVKEKKEKTPKMKKARAVPKTKAKKAAAKEAA